VAVDGWIIDKSVATRIHHPEIAAQLAAADGPLYLCEVGLLEQLYSARSAPDYDLVLNKLRSSFDILEAPGDVLRRAQLLQQRLAHHQGVWHRRPIPDLLIAVTAMHHEVGVAHADSDFDLIAQVAPLRSWKLTVN
jgi:predicted nucleic acid-binding protein